jgi:curved DNA-binding protein CbpA
MNLSFTDNPYKVLGVERTASEAEIKQAYFSLLRQNPPERDPEGFKRIRAAYEKLRATSERAETDLFLIDDRFTELKLEDIQHFDVAPPLPTAETIRQDLIALEAMLLLEEAAAP